LVICTQAHPDLLRQQYQNQVPLVEMAAYPQRLKGLLLHGLEPSNPFTTVLLVRVLIDVGKG
jgi:hypothetical protein